MASAPTPVPEKVKKVYKYFDLETFEEKKEEVEVSFTAPGTVQEALQRIENSQDVLLKAITAFLKRAALKESKREIAKKGAKKSLVLSAVRVFRTMPPFDKIEDRKEQTRQLIEVLKSNKVMVDSLKAQALRDAESDEDGDEETSEEE